MQDAGYILSVSIQHSIVQCSMCNIVQVMCNIAVRHFYSVFFIYIHLIIFFYLLLICVRITSHSHCTYESAVNNVFNCIHWETSLPFLKLCVDHELYGDPCFSICVLCLPNIYYELRTILHLCVYVCIYIYIYIYMCVCVCVFYLCPSFALSRYLTQIQDF